MGGIWLTEGENSLSKHMLGWGGLRALMTPRAVLIVLLEYPELS